MRLVIQRENLGKIKALMEKLNNPSISHTVNLILELSVLGVFVNVGSSKKVGEDSRVVIAPNNTRLISEHSNKYGIYPSASLNILIADYFIGCATSTPQTQTPTPQTPTTIQQTQTPTKPTKSSRLKTISI